MNFSTRKLRATGVFLVWLASVSAAAQPSPCDPELLRLSGDDALAYRQRGDRCEGSYALPVGAQARLQLSSVTAWFPAVEPKDQKHLDLTWSPPPAAGLVHVRATSLRYRVYYRMDALRRAADRRYSWSTDVVSQVDVRRRELGLLAWTTMTVGARRRDVYLPLTVGPSPRPAERRVQVIVLPSVELQEVYYSITRYDANGNRVGASVRDQPLRLGLYPAHRPIQITLPAGGTPPFSHVDVRAVTASGGSLRKDFWLFDER